MVTVTKYRVCPWAKYDDEADEVKYTYGLQARVGPRQWAYVAEGTEPVFFAKAEDAEAEVKRLNKTLKSR